jgi:hypothetical protein
MRHRVGRPPAAVRDDRQPDPLGRAVRNVDTQVLIDAAGPSPQARTDRERDWHVRQVCLRRDKAASRDQRKTLSIERIRDLVQRGDSADILNLFKQRHTWRQHAIDHMADGRVICKVDCCPHVATAGSEFCINHILLDSNQKLFCECPSCHRPYPAMAACFACRRK